MVRCDECGYNLCGSPIDGECPECGTQYDQVVLIADQEKSHRSITAGLRIVGVLAALYLANSVAWVISEDVMHVSGGWLELIVLIGLPGGAALLLAFALLQLRLQHMNRLNRPVTDIRQARLIPEDTRWWIGFIYITLLPGLFFSWGNPCWHALLRMLKSGL